MIYKKFLNVVLIVAISVFIIGCETTLIPETDPVMIDEEEILLDDNYDRFFNHENHKTLVIFITQDQASLLDQSMQAYFDQFGNYKSDEYIMSHITYQDEFGTIDMQDVPFRTRGNLSRNRFLNEEGILQLNHFKLKFNQQFTDITRDGFLFGLEELDLKYNRNYDETYMNEFGAFKLYEAYDVVAQRATLIYVEVHIDEVIYKVGVMTAFEPIDEWFIKRRFDYKDGQIGDLYKSLWQQFGPANLANLKEGAIGIKDVSINYRPAYDLKTNKNTSTHDALNLLIDVLASEDMTFKKAFVEANMDIQALSKMFAVSFLLGNPDDFRSMANNYYLYVDSVTETYHFMPYDLDHSLGQGWDGAPVFENQLINNTLYHFGEVFSYLTGQEVNHPLMEVLFDMDSFKFLYEAHLETLIQTSFTFDFFKAFIDTYKPIYEEDISNSMMSLSFGYRDLSSYISQKSEFVLNQIHTTT